MTRASGLFTLPGDAADIHRSAQAYGDFATSAVTLSTDLKGATAPGWQGDESETFTQKRDALPPLLTQAFTAFSTSATALHTFANALAEGQRQMATLAAEHATAVVQVRAAQAEYMEAAKTAAGDETVQGLARQVEGLQQGVSDVEGRAAKVRATVEEAAAVCAGKIKAVSTAPRPPKSVRCVDERSLPFLLEIAPTPPRPIESMTPAERRRWWLGLTPAQQDALGRQDSQKWGNMEGIPVEDRDRFNRLTKDAQLQAGQRMFEDAGVPVPRTVAEDDALTAEQRLRLAFTDTRRVGPHGNAYTVKTLDPAKRAALEQYRAALALDTALAPEADKSVPTLLVTYEPEKFQGRGRTMVSVGNPETADNLAVMVPGLTSRTSTMPGGIRDAKNLQRVSTVKNRDARTAVIVWQGYDAPQLPLMDGTEKMETLGENTAVASQDKADAGARQLSSDVANLESARGNRGRITVIGHSYGSTTTGLALQRYGLADHVEQVALIGSPGVGGDARSVSDLHLRPEQFFAGSASQDKVTTVFAAHGANPADEGFGGTRFRAEAADRGTTFLDDHTNYYRMMPEQSGSTGGVPVPGHPSESLEALGDITSGRSDQLAADGLHADPRTTRHLENPEDGSDIQFRFDPESARQPHP